MIPSPPHCPRCKTALPERLIETMREINCPNCRSMLSILTFPALYKPVSASSAGDRVIAEGEATCFYHSAKKAVVPCDACGRFLCALCDIEFDGQHLCVACIESGQRKGRMENLENSRKLYDDLALILAALPVIILCFWPASVITAPAAIFVVIRYWNTPSSIIPRTKIRFVLAFILAILQCAGWAFFLYRMLGDVGG